MSLKLEQKLLAAGHRAFKAMDKIDKQLKADPSAYLDLISVTSTELPEEVQEAMRKAYLLIHEIRVVNERYRDEEKCPVCGHEVEEDG
jgi:DNA repair exonuclease SbcCD ATPase subunit